MNKGETLITDANLSIEEDANSSYYAALSKEAIKYIASLTTTKLLYTEPSNENIMIQYPAKDPDSQTTVLGTLSYEFLFESDENKELFEHFIQKIRREVIETITKRSRRKLQTGART